MAYLAVPSMGAVLHALNIRLFPEQLVYVARHGGSQVVLNGPVDEATTSALAEHTEGVHDFATLVADQPTSFDWPEDLSEDDASSMCYTSGTTRHPKGIVYSHRSN